MNTDVQATGRRQERPSYLHPVLLPVLRRDTSSRCDRNRLEMILQVQADAEHLDVVGRDVVQHGFAAVEAQLGVVAA